MTIRTVATTPDCPYFQPRVSMPAAVKAPATVP